MDKVRSNRFQISHKDSFGFLRTALGGATTWTPRVFRNTGIVLDHVAKGDVFTYTIQFNHDKALQANVDDFHLHFAPVGAITAGQVVSINYSWGLFPIGSEIPDTLPNTGNSPITLAVADLNKHKVADIVQNLVISGVEAYSSFLFIRCERLNTAADTYASEIALIGADCHYTTDRRGSLSTYSE